MPKLKTKKGVRKRFRKTKSGKFKRSTGGKSHLLTGKGRKRLRKLKRSSLVSKAQTRMIKTMLPYG